MAEKLPRCKKRSDSQRIMVERGNTRCIALITFSDLIRSFSTSFDIRPAFVEAEHNQAITYSESRRVTVQVTTTVRRTSIRNVIERFV